MRGKWYLGQVGGVPDGLPNGPCARTVLRTGGGSAGCMVVSPAWRASFSPHVIIMNTVVISCVTLDSSQLRDVLMHLRHAQE